jgi:hypothetical protein
MKSPKPIIKFNSGQPVALCNRCFCMMCYVSCENDNDLNEHNCVVIEKRSYGDVNLTSVNIGEPPPSFCDACIKFLFSYCLN